MTAVDEMIGALLAAPHLPRARCRGQHLLTDVWDDPLVIEYCQQELCAKCPELQPCRAWVESLTPSKRPLGVTAGLVRRPRWPRQSKETAA